MLNEFHQLQTPVPNAFVLVRITLLVLRQLYCIPHPLHLGQRPNTRNDLSIHETQRDRAVNSRIPRPRKIITAHIDMTFGDLPQVSINHTDRTHTHTKLT